MDVEKVREIISKVREICTKRKEMEVPCREVERYLTMLELRLGRGYRSAFLVSYVKAAADGIDTLSTWAYKLGFAALSTELKHLAEELRAQINS